MRAAGHRCNLRPLPEKRCEPRKPTGSQPHVGALLWRKSRSGATVCPSGRVLRSCVSRSRKASSHSVRWRKDDLGTGGIVLDRMFDTFYPINVHPRTAQHEFGALHAPFANRGLGTIIVVPDGSIRANRDFTDPYEAAIAIQYERVPMVVVRLPFTVQNRA